MLFKAVLVFFCGVLVAHAQSDEKTCPDLENSERVRGLEIGNTITPCFTDIENHIKLELNASLTYIKLGAHFLQANYFRPGIAHMLLKHASEERQHAKALMDYLLMRGHQLKEDVIGEINPGDVLGQWNEDKSKSLVFQGLVVAFNLEKKVRDEFTRIIKSCEDTPDPKHENSDYHASDVLTGEFLDEQHKGVRELAGHISTLDRLIKGGVSITLAEMEFDKSLLA